MKASDNLNEEMRKLAYGEYVKERVNIKNKYYGLNFEEFVQKRYPWRYSRLYKSNFIKQFKKYEKDS